MTQAFVYRWREHATGKWYVGFHKGSPDDGYICSSRTVKPEILHRPDEWSRKILRTGTKEDMIALEHKILRRLDARRNPRSYNRSSGGLAIGPVSHADQLGYDLTKMTAKEIAQHYKQELDAGDPERICLFDMWLIKRLISNKKHVVAK